MTGIHCRCSSDQRRMLICHCMIRYRVTYVFITMPHVDVNALMGPSTLRRTSDVTFHLLFKLLLFNSTGQYSDKVASCAKRIENISDWCIVQFYARYYV